LFTHVIGLKNTSKIPKQEEASLKMVEHNNVTVEYMMEIYLRRARTPICARPT